jgi:hypothetical protein
MSQLLRRNSPARAGLIDLPAECRKLTNPRVSLPKELFQLTGNPRPIKLLALYTKNLLYVCQVLAAKEHHLEDT